MGLDAVTRFWNKVHKTETCWLWQGTKNLDGYGRFNPAGRLVGAHRFSFTLVHGPIPQGINVLHKCDTPACVNPDHLFLGTQLDNILDMYAKGKHRKYAIGSNCPNHLDRPISCSGVCRQCYNKEYRLQNRDRLIEHGRQFYRNNRERLLKQKQEQYRRDKNVGSAEQPMAAAPGQP